MKLRPVAGAVLLFALILAFACNGDGGDTSELPSGLPESFPADFPIYSPVSESSGVDLGGRIIAQFETSDPRAQVADFYRQALNQPPWRIISVADVMEQDTTLITFDNLDDPSKGGTLAILTETTNGQNTLIVVSIMPPGPA